MAMVVLTGLTACGGGGGSVATPAQTANNALVEMAPGDLAGYFKARWMAALQGGAQAATTSAALPPGAALSWAGTPLQEPGVDEDDRIKTDGTRVYALQAADVEGGVVQPARLSTQQRQPDGALGDLNEIPLNPEFTPLGMYLPAGLNRLVVLGQRAGDDVWIAAGAAGTRLALPAVTPSQRKVSIDLYQTGTRPTPLTRLELDGALVGSRMVGSVLYVVSTWTPDVSRYQVPAGSTPAQVQAALMNLDAAELLPRVRVDGAAAQALVTESECLMQPGNASPGLQLTTITALDLSAPGTPLRSRCLVGGVESMYMSAGHVYFATAQGYWVGGDAWVARFPQDARTDIHKFALQGLHVNYRGTGEVRGHLGWDAQKKPLRMSEYQGDLRVLSFTGETGWTGLPDGLSLPRPVASPATLTVLREDSAMRRLSTVATLPNSRRPAALGHAGEQVYAVHFAGPRAYVVTFRRTDPLYVLDLTDPQDPRAASELVMPGYADYLFPLPGDRLLGIGRDATNDGRVQGLKFTLMDVTDPAQPRLLDSLLLGDAGSQSALDSTRQGVNLFTQGAQVRVALPVRVMQGAGIAAAAGWQGLARFLADTGAGTLTALPAVETFRFSGGADDAARLARNPLALERSVQMDSGAYYLRGGAVVHAR